MAKVIKQGRGNILPWLGIKDLMKSQLAFDPSRGAAGDSPGERKQSLQRICGGSTRVLGACMRGTLELGCYRGCVQCAGLWQFGKVYLPDDTHL